MKLLMKLYVSASRTFPACLIAYRTSSSITSAKPLASASTILILTNPAHQTALNARKRLVADSLLDPHSELELTAHILTASKDHAKQSTLWDHRRWLLRSIYATSSDFTFRAPPPRGWSCDRSRHPSMPPAVIERELALALRACEMYPRNYHAWTYRHDIFETVLRMLDDENCDESQKATLIAIVEAEVEQIVTWIDRHVSDYTAVQHLCSVVLAFGTTQASKESQQCMHKRSIPLVDPDVLIRHAMSLLQSYPEHETLARYLQLALKIFPPPPELKARTEMLLRACGRSRQSAP